jgi:hypothetical protein
LAVKVSVQGRKSDRDYHIKFAVNTTTKKANCIRVCSIIF